MTKKGEKNCQFSVVRQVLLKKKYSCNPSLTNGYLISPMKMRSFWEEKQTFRMLSNNIFLSSGKSKLKLSESRWTELIIYGVIYSNFNKFNKYFDFIGNSYFLRSIFILLIIFIIL